MHGQYVLKKFTDISLPLIQNFLNYKSATGNYILDSSLWTGSENGFFQIYNTENAIVTSYNEQGNIDTSALIDNNLVDNLKFKSYAAPVDPTGTSLWTDGRTAGVVSSSENTACYVPLRGHYSQEVGCSKIVFDKIDISLYSNVIFSIDYWYADISWESSDFFHVNVYIPSSSNQLSVSDNGTISGTKIEIINHTGNTDIELEDDEIWRTISYELPINTTDVIIEIVSRSSTESEEMRFTNIKLTDKFDSEETESEPEPEPEPEIAPIDLNNDKVTNISDLLLLARMTLQKENPPAEPEPEPEPQPEPQPELLPQPELEPPNPDYNMELLSFNKSNGGLVFKCSNIGTEDSIGRKNLIKHYNGSSNNVYKSNNAYDEFQILPVEPLSYDASGITDRHRPETNKRPWLPSNSYHNRLVQMGGDSTAYPIVRALGSVLTDLNLVDNEINYISISSLINTYDQTDEQEELILYDKNGISYRCKMCGAWTGAYYSFARNTIMVEDYRANFYSGNLVGETAFPWLGYYTINDTSITYNSPVNNFDYVDDQNMIFSRQVYANMTLSFNNYFQFGIGTTAYASTVNQDTTAGVGMRSGDSITATINFSKLVPGFYLLNVNRAFDTEEADMVKNSWEILNGFGINSGYEWEAEFLEIDESSSSNNNIVFYKPLKEYEDYFSYGIGETGYKLFRTNHLDPSNAAWNSSDSGLRHHGCNLNDTAKLIANEFIYNSGNLNGINLALPNDFTLDSSGILFQKIQETRLNSGPIYVFCHCLNDSDSNSAITKLYRYNVDGTISSALLNTNIYNLLTTSSGFIQKTLNDVSEEEATQILSGSQNRLASKNLVSIGIILKDTYGDGWGSTAKVEIWIGSVTTPTMIIDSSNGIPVSSNGRNWLYYYIGDVDTTTSIRIKCSGGDTYIQERILMIVRSDDWNANSSNWNDYNWRTYSDFVTLFESANAGQTAPPLQIYFEMGGYNATAENPWINPDQNDGSYYFTLGTNTPVTPSDDMEIGIILKDRWGTGWNADDKIEIWIGSNDNIITIDDNGFGIPQSSDGKRWIFTNLGTITPGTLIRVKVTGDTGTLANLTRRYWKIVSTTDWNANSSNWNYFEWTTYYKYTLLCEYINVSPSKLDIFYEKGLAGVGDQWPYEEGMNTSPAINLDTIDGSYYFYMPSSPILNGPSVTAPIKYWNNRYSLSMSEGTINEIVRYWNAGQEDRTPENDARVRLGIDYIPYNEDYYILWKNPDYIPPSTSGKSYRLFMKSRYSSGEPAIITISQSGNVIGSAYPFVGDQYCMYEILLEDGDYEINVNNMETSLLYALTDSEKIICVNGFTRSTYIGGTGITVSTQDIILPDETFITQNENLIGYELIPGGYMGFGPQYGNVATTIADTSPIINGEFVISFRTIKFGGAKIHTYWYDNNYTSTSLKYMSIQFIETNESDEYFYNYSSGTESESLSGSLWIYGPLSTNLTTYKCVFSRNSNMIYHYINNTLLHSHTPSFDFSSLGLGYVWMMSMYSWAITYHNTIYISGTVTEDNGRNYNLSDFAEIYATSDATGSATVNVINSERIFRWFLQNDAGELDTSYPSFTSNINKIKTSNYPKELIDPLFFAHQKEIMASQKF